MKTLSDFFAHCETLENCSSTIVNYGALELEFFDWWVNTEAQLAIL